MFPQLSVAVHVLMIVKAFSHTPEFTSSISTVISTSSSQLSDAKTPPIPSNSGISSHSTVISAGTPTNSGAVLSPTFIVCSVTA